MFRVTRFSKREHNQRSQRVGPRWFAAALNTNNTVAVPGPVHGLHVFVIVIIPLVSWRFAAKCCSPSPFLSRQVFCSRSIFIARSLSFAGLLMLVLASFFSPACISHLSCCCCWCCRRHAACVCCGKQERILCRFLRNPVLLRLAIPRGSGRRKWAVVVVVFYFRFFPLVSLHSIPSHFPDVGSGGDASKINYTTLVLTFQNQAKFASLAAPVKPQ